MASTSSAAPSTSTAAKSCNYDVFINHRGEDVKKTFASHLYRCLLSRGITAFLDQPELERGEYFATQIDDVMRSAAVHVAIFSPRYAQSSWCLNELLVMLASKAPIIPVFYHVKPAELRWTRGKQGTYAKALEEMENKLRYDSSKIEDWRNALSEVAGISGFELEAFNGDEGELVDKVVDEVLKKLKKPDIHVAKYPKGLDDKIKDFEKSVRLQQEPKPQIVGIVGLGGVGKTTLAKEFYNRKRKNSDYSTSCFLSDVKDQKSKDRLISLQKSLLKSLYVSDKEIERVDGVDEGIGMLKKHLKSTKALIVLDDVDHGDQVDAFFSHQTDLHPQSLILITSRNMDVLTKTVESTSIYKLTGLDTPQAKELFCSHAFNQPSPPPEFQSLVEEFLKTCDGLPLSLKVFGALLYKNDDKCQWQSLLDKLEVPSEIRDRLRISYDSLSPREQQIFLDIACFFIGEERDTAIKIWDDGSGWNGLWSFQNIENKCLVEVNSENKIKMHDHLRDMGREIAEASLPRRLWRPTENEDDGLLEHSLVTDKVRGIRMFPSRDNDSIDDSSEMPWYQRRTSELFGNCVMELCSLLCNTRYPFNGTVISLKNLKLVHTEDDFLERILRRTDFSNLLWLRWDNCPCSSLPSWISMKNLRVLQLQGSKLETLWKKEWQAPLQLRELKIGAPSFSATEESIGQLNIPNSIGMLKYLERIVIGPKDYSNEVNLAKLPEEFCLLQSLKVLVLIRCSQMKSLPECLGNLTNLLHIDLSGCSKLERLPDSFCKLVKLQYLNLGSCSNLTMSTETLGNISTLEYINLTGCRKIGVLPPQVAHQRSLKQLCFGYINLNIQESRGVIGELRDLKVLVIGCLLPSSLCSLNSLKNLKGLGFYGFEQLNCLPDWLGDLGSLIKLAIRNCKELEHLRAAIGELTQLTKLDVGQTGVSFAEGVCFNLKFVNIQRCSNAVVSFAESVCCSIVNIQECSNVVVASFAESVCFSIVNIQKCSNVVVASFAQGVCIKLESLSIDLCSNVVVSFETVCFNNVRIQMCSNVVVTFAKGVFFNLECLSIQSCRDVVVSFGSVCFNIVNIQSCSNVVVASIAQDVCIKLETLNIDRCSNVEVSFESVCFNDVMIHRCGNVVVTFAKDVFFNLECLSIQSCRDVVVSFGSVCFNVVNIQSCSNVVVASIAQGVCIKLETLNIDRCSNVEVSFESVCFNDVMIHRCSNVVVTFAKDVFFNLECLSIRNCRDVVVSFESVCFNVVMIHGCRNVVVTFAKGVSFNLECLNIQNCSDVVVSSESV